METTLTTYTKPAETRAAFYRRMNQVGIAKAVERKEQATMTTLEPQTAAYQANVDTIAHFISTEAISIQNAWNFSAGSIRFDRWDYENELYAMIEQETRNRHNPFAARWEATY